MLLAMGSNDQSDAGRLSMRVPIGPIHFHANDVCALTEVFTEDCVVHGAYFGFGDPDAGGEHWNFTRGADEDDDDGVCTVREPQRAVFYEGIESFVLERGQLSCRFDRNGQAETQVSKLEITFELDDDGFKELVEMLRRVFKEREYFVER